MKDLKTIVARAPFLQSLPDADIDCLLSIALTKAYKKGEPIFSEGEHANGFYIVAEGKVKIFKLSIDGKEHILHIFGPGNPFGEVPVFAGKAFPANAMTLAKSTLIFLPREAFVGLITANPSIALNMLAILSLRLREFTVQIEHLSLKEVPGRLAAYLIFLSKEQKNDRTVSLKISKGQLASLLGTIPETLSRIFTKMSGMNLIDVDGKQIHLNDMTGLAELAEQGKI
jgi:CRP/FNR family transcriptional regulator